MFLKSKGFLRNTGHWKKHGFETFSGFEKQDNIARWSMRKRRATKVIFFRICAHYGKNGPLRAHRDVLWKSQKCITKRIKTREYLRHYVFFGKILSKTFTHLNRRERVFFFGVLFFPLTIPKVTNVITKGEVASLLLLLNSIGLCIRQSHDIFFYFCFDLHLFNVMKFFFFDSWGLR